MKVSVIITTCGRDPQIVEEAIKSVIDQTYKDCEIIVVNDCPEYEKRDALEGMIHKYNGITLYTNETQKGANYSRNFGAEHSNGEILSFLDDDDYWDYERLKCVVDEINNGAEVVYSDYIIFSERKKWYNKRLLPDQDRVIERILAGNFMGGFSIVSFTRKAFEEAGRLDESMPSYQDQDLFIRLLQAGSLAYVSRPLCYYRVSSNSISLNGKKKIEGLSMLLKKYDDLFERYPESKQYRLECELVYSAKQGWKENVKEIEKILKMFDNPAKILALKIKGYAKFFGVRFLRMQ